MDSTYNNRSTGLKWTFPFFTLAGGLVSGLVYQKRLPYLPASVRFTLIQSTFFNVRKYPINIIDVMLF